MKIVVFITCLAMFAISGFAQEQNRKIAGLLKNLSNEVVPGATVRLSKPADSTFSLSRMSNNSGKFEFTRLPAGTYLLTITAVGNKQFTSAPLSLGSAQENINLPVIFLLPAKSNNLKEVVVTAKRPLVEQEVDKTIINVDAMISSGTSNTLEVLEKTPGVTVGTDGEISLNGQKGVLVLIDGRATYMSGQDLAAYLRSLPGGLLDKIELMTNPPARFDASGSSVINIRLKKKTTQGYTGDVSLGYSQGTYARNQEALNLHFSDQKIHIFSNLSLNRGRSYVDDFYERTFYNPDLSLRSGVVLRNDQTFHSGGSNVRAGVDYTASSKTTYGFIINFNKNTRSGRQENYGQNFNPNDLVDSIGTGLITGGNKRINSGANLNFLHKFNSAGREISADLNYSKYKSSGSQQLYNRMDLPDGRVTSADEFYYDLPADISIYTVEADYVHPLRNKAGLETGIKSSFVTNDNNSGYYEVEANTLKPDYRKSNHFVYRENIHAAYLNTRKSWLRLSAQLGVRMEYTQSSGRQLGNVLIAASSFSRQYLNLFPSAFFSYKLDSTGKNSLNLSMSRRLNRPNYGQLSPFVMFQDNYSYTSGNPLLRPQFNGNYELTYRHKNWLGVGMRYSKFSNIIMPATEAIENIFITRPDNFANGYFVALSTDLSMSPAKWWNLNANIAGRHLAIKGTINNQNIDNSWEVLRVNLNNQFRFNKNWSAEAGGNYMGQDRSSQTVMSEMFRANAAIQKKILKGKGNLKVSVEDIFHSAKTTERLVTIKQVASLHTNVSDTRRLGIAFSYGFGKETFARKRKNTDNAADEEKARVN